MKKTNITGGTIARTAILILALVNQCLSMAGFPLLPIEDAQVESVVTTVWTVAAALAAWWKNNSFTKAALRGDAVKRSLKEEV